MQPKTEPWVGHANLFQAKSSRPLFPGDCPPQALPTEILQPPMPSFVFLDYSPSSISHYTWPELLNSFLPPYYPSVSPSLNMPYTHYRWIFLAYSCDHIIAPLGCLGLTTPHSSLSWDKSSPRNSSVLRVHWIPPSLTCPGISGYQRAPTESPVSGIQFVCMSRPAWVWKFYLVFNTQSKCNLSHAAVSVYTDSTPYVWSPIMQCLALCYGTFCILSYVSACILVSLLDWNSLEALREENLGHYWAFILCQVFSPCPLTR